MRPLDEGGSGWRLGVSFGRMRHTSLMTQRTPMYQLLKQCTPIQTLVYSVQGVPILPPNLDAQSILDERNAEKLVIEPFVEV